MKEFFEGLGISESVFTYVVIPALIFLARVCDVSINTVRIIFVMHGKKLLAPLLGFFEAFIWLLAIRQIITNIDAFYSYFAYAGGFATGTFLGMVIEEKLALGRVVVRVITQNPAEQLTAFLKEKGYRYSNLDAESNDGKVNVLFTVVKRDELPTYINIIKKYNPQAYYTVESVKKVSDDDVFDQPAAYQGVLGRLRGINRS
ncbi:MAG: DUF2179 domain-containing protein [Imperialibacter sp.]|jgi:uncharacterized protein YebE (UPF0316 family)|uniref:UPF0316 protein RT717_23425 n=1 Tax=Imperialibacter roseus TaxID=1324217 RepID=A0ABZ0IMT5_9BACT|nr:MULTISPECIES: DUF2179 domain-containing protein [Imperialibacter]WOK06031.1 DUF2179 domain-containing protein [Imperialibacter roseus]CAD5270440.1 conserved membrane hypothetical protein [Imperialibacter sp. 89]CAD5298223.1 conserved membrane hypothetical protein [Imperialibacter sp. 75]VVT34825.1 conserved membrane hypothetical protein [Imperialibacter sp. EC-SDR9]|tara:strand:- start:2616 stop:3221 length:606 start_codon:yes stop_codon:yes gene_type:complete